MEIYSTEIQVKHMNRAYKRVTMKTMGDNAIWYIRDIMTARWIKLPLYPNARTEYDRLEDMYQQLFKDFLVYGERK